MRKNYFIILALFALFSLGAYAQKGIVTASSQSSKPPKTSTSKVDRSAFQDKEAVIKLIKSQAKKSSTASKTRSGKSVSISTYKSSAVYKAPSEGNALIILEAGDIWGDGSGYQMLLDPTHSTYGTVIPTGGGLTTSGDASADVYAQFAYKIPTNADGSLTTTNIVLNNSVSIEVPAGTYDYCITNPTPSDRVWIAGGTYGRGDDFVFEAGHTYLFKVVLSGVNDYVELHTDHDAGLTALQLPENSADLTASEPISVTVKNFGLTPISGFTLSYSVDGGTPVSEIYSGTIESSDSAVYTFNAKADLSAKGTHTVLATVTLPDGADEVPSNDTISGQVINFAPITALPFTENFNSLATFNTNWTILDANGDGSTWAINPTATGADGTKGYARYTYSGVNDADDYLVLRPVSLPSGKYNIRFYYRAASASFPEGLEILYGKDLEHATSLFKNESITSSAWTFGSANFDVAESGNYSFYVHAISAADMYYLYFDNFTLDAGEFSGTPDLSIANVVLPYSSCNISAASTIGAVVKNTGTGAVSSFNLSYSVNGGAAVTESFNQAIPTGGQATVTFQHTADFSAVGNYAVTVNVVSTTPAETNTSNNSLTKTVANTVPVSALPFTSNFATNSADTLNWSPASADSWFYADGYYQASTVAPLISKCLDLKAGVYKVEYTYTGGFEFLGYQFPTTLDLTFGKSGTDMSTWSNIASLSLISDVDEVGENTFTVSEDGTYEVAFTPTELNGLGFSKIVIEQVADNDVRVNSVTSTLPAQVPVLFTDSPYQYDVVVENRGGKTQSAVNVSILRGDETIASAGPVSLAPGEVKTVSLTYQFAQLSVGDVVLDFVASIPDADANPADNTLSVTAVVTDSTYALDRTTDLGNGIGAGIPIAFGTIFDFPKAATLTSVDLGFSQTADNEFGLAVYKITDQDKLGEEVYSDIFQRGVGGTIKNFPIPAQQLVAGKYYFELQQLDSTNLAVASDGTANGVLYVRDDTTITSLVKFGYLCIRPNFADSLNTGITNPTSDKDISISYDSQSGTLSVKSSKDISVLNVYSLSGYAVSSGKFNKGITETSVNCRNFASGVYVAKVQTLAGTKNYKFVVGQSGSRR